MNQQTVIFDLDGTLADVTHRRVHLTHKKDWRAWNAAMKDDAPNWPIINLLQNISSLYRIMILSGRIEKEDGVDYRAITIDWLNKYGIIEGDSYEDLWMRPEGEYCSDVVLKRRMLQALRADGHDVAFVVDDRKCVVDLWREEGLTCLQCDYGDFDMNKYAPGKLILMVGPSGSGKSTFVQNTTYADKDVVVSSDKIRENICDDFKDQSKNQQVFAALHSIVKSRIENGMMTIVDATNLRNRDRKSILDVVPNNTPIEYWVINRSMEDKRRDGGWRNEVMVKGKSLLDYHEDIFNSNLNDILAGDNDERIKVRDLRST